MKIIFYSHANRTYFHNKGFSLSLVLKLRVFGTRKWRIVFLFTESRSRVRLLLVAYIDTVYKSFWYFDNRFQVKSSQVMEDTEVNKNNEYLCFIRQACRQQKLAYKCGFFIDSNISRIYHMSSYEIFSIKVYVRKSVLPYKPN